MQASAVTTTPPSTSVVGLAGLALIGGYVVALFHLMDTTSYDIWGAMILGPGLFLLSLPLLRREARRADDPRLLWILVAALALKLLATVARYYIGFVVYGGSADAASYHGHGIDIMESLRDGVIPGGIWQSGTDFVRLLTGSLYLLTWPTLLGGFMVYSWLAFWGLFFFYKAFALAVPEGNKRLYLALGLFLPSLLYWPASTGKEAWMLFSLGIAFYGCAVCMSKRLIRGLVIAALGIAMCSIVRIHIGTMVGIALMVALLVKRASPRLGLIGPLAKTALVVAMVPLALLLVSSTEEFLGVDDLLSKEGVTSALETTASRNDEGGSQFKPHVVTSPAHIPAALVTVLFRPFPNEATNAQSLASSLEGVVLMLIVIVRWRSFARAVRYMRRSPYLAAAVAYLLMFAIAFSSFPNFGLLARERVQVLPIFLTLLCISLARKPKGAHNAPA